MKGAIVIIEFADQDIQDICENDKRMRKKWGHVCASKLQTRLADLQAAVCVSDLTCGKPHPLKYKRLGQFSVSILGGLRLIFECGNDPIPKTSDDAVDWNQVTIIRIISIEDYHE